MPCNTRVMQMCFQVVYCDVRVTVHVGLVAQQLGGDDEERPKQSLKGTVVGAWLQSFVCSISPRKMVQNLLELGLVCLWQ